MCEYSFLEIYDVLSKYIIGTPKNKIKVIICKNYKIVTLILIYKNYLIYTW